MGVPADGVSGRRGRPGAAPRQMAHATLEVARRPKVHGPRPRTKRETGEDSIRQLSDGGGYTDDTTTAGLHPIYRSTPRWTPKGDQDRQNWQAIYELSPLGVVVYNSDGDVVKANGQALSYFGAEQDAIGHLSSVMQRQMLRPDGTTVTSSESPHGRALRTGQPQHGIVLGLVDENGVCRWLRVDAIPILDADGEPEQVLELYTDVTEHQQALRQARITQAVAAALTPWPRAVDVMPSVVRSIRDQLRWEVGAWWALDKAASVLRCRFISTVHAAPCPAFRALSRGLPLPCGADLPGRAWEYGGPIWLEDVGAAHWFLRTIPALQEGIRCGVAIPIRKDGAIYGVVEFLCRHVQPVDQALLQTLFVVGEQIGHALGRLSAEEEQRISQERFGAVMAGAPLMVLICDHGGTLRLAEGRVLQEVGRMPGELVGKSLFTVCATAPAVIRAARRALRGHATSVRAVLGGRPFDWSLTPVLDVDGTVTEMIAVATDRSAADTAGE